MLQHSIPKMTKKEWENFRDDYQEGKGRINVTVRSFY